MQETIEFIDDKIYRRFIMSEENYTFEDWVNDQEPTYYRNYPDLDETLEFGKSGFYPHLLHESGKITDEEFEKIRNEQKRVYDRVVNYHKQKRLEELQESLNNAPSKERYLTHRKSAIEAELQKADQDILNDVYSGKWSPYRIDSFTYREIIKREDEGKPPEELKGLAPSSLMHTGPIPDPGMPPDWNTIVVDEHFKLTILYHEFMEVERLLQEIEGKAATTVPVGTGGQVEHRDIESAEISKRVIYQRYHQLYEDGAGLKQAEAYQRIEDWLVNDIGFSTEDVKRKFDITLEFDSFTRGARNNRF